MIGAMKIGPTKRRKKSETYSAVKTTNRNRCWKKSATKMVTRSAAMYGGSLHAMEVCHIIVGVSATKAADIAADVCKAQRVTMA